MYGWMYVSMCLEIHVGVHTLKLEYYFTPSIAKLNVFLSLQADHLRQETLVQMSRILTIRQAAHGLLTMGGYFHLLRNFRTRLMSKI